MGLAVPEGGDIVTSTQKRYYTTNGWINDAVTEIYEMQGMREADPEHLMGCQFARIIAKHLAPGTPDPIEAAAREVGTRIGRAIARDVLADDMPREWTGLDAQDGDQLTTAGILPHTAAWEWAEQCAKAAYLEAVEQVAS